MRLFKRFFIITLCLFLVSGCSTKLAYNFLPFLLKWYVGQYVSLTHEQKQTLSVSLKSFHTWHRTTQLPIYANYVQDVTHRIQSETITGKWIHNETDKVQLMIDDSVNILKPTAISLLASLSDKQTKEIEKNLKKDRKKYRKKYVDISDKKIIRNRKEKLLDYIGPFFGSFSKEQKRWIEDWAKNIKPYEALTLKQQQLLSEKINLALDNRKNRAELTRLVDEIMFYRTDDWDPELEAILDDNQESTYALLAKLVNSQKTNQKKKMLAKLNSYRKDFISLNKKAKSTTPKE